MNSRRKFLTAGGVLAALSAVSKATADQDQSVNVVYIHGLVWNRQLAAPMNDWLIRLDANVSFPIGNPAPFPSPGFATLGDDFHDPVGSHVVIHKATLKDDQLTIDGTISESKTPGLTGQSVRIEGKVVGVSVQGLTVRISGSTFTGAGFLSFVFKTVFTTKIDWSVSDGTDDKDDNE